MAIKPNRKLSDKKMMKVYEVSLGFHVEAKSMAKAKRFCDRLLRRIYREDRERIVGDGNVYVDEEFRRGNIFETMINFHAKVENREEADDFYEDLAQKIRHENPDRIVECGVIAIDVVETPKRMHAKTKRKKK